MFAVAVALLAAGLAFRLTRRRASPGWLVTVVVVTWCLAIVLSVCVAAMVKNGDTGYPPGVGLEGEDTDHSRHIVATGFWVAPAASLAGVALAQRAGRRRR